MLKRLRFFGLVTAILFLGTGAAVTKEPVRETLQRQSQELLDAVTAGAPSVWDRYLDDRVRYVDETGEVLTKKDMLEGIRPLPAGVTGSIKVTGFDVAEHGNVAVATHVADENEVFHGHKLHCQYRVTETWMKSGEAWRLILSQVLAMRTDPPAIPLKPSAQKEYCGRYALTPAMSYEIRCRGEALEGQRTGGKPEPLRAEAPDVLFVPGRPRYRYVFLRNGDGKITGFAQRREAWDLVWKREG